VRPASSAPDFTVFLNLPFDQGYRPLFLAMLAGLVALGRKPHCVLEIPSGGQNRLDRIYGLIEQCGASIHDLSRVSLSGSLRVPRFNMPFELGMAYSIARRQAHSFFVLEERSYRIQASLSDFNGHDPHIHEGTQDGVLRCLLDCFGTPGSRQPTFAALQSLTRKLSRVVATLEKEQGTQHPFHPYIFRQAVAAAVQLARAEGLIA
jgi:hypothetical protein